jgi:large subunit ribosomal protein L10
MAKSEKELMIEELAGEMRQSSAVLIASFRNIPAAEMNKLRRGLSGYSARHIVVKNSICRLALQRCDLENLCNLLKGSICISLIRGNEVAAAVKTLVNFAKAREGLKLHGGYIGGEVFSVQQIKELASLPSREVLIGQAVGNIKSPLVRLVMALGGTLRKLNLVLDAIGKTKGSSEK